MGGGAADDSEESLSGAIPAAPALEGMVGGGKESPTVAWRGVLEVG